jgi:hypothetical protein
MAFTTSDYASKKMRRVWKSYPKEKVVLLKVSRLSNRSDRLRNFGFEDPTLSDSDRWVMSAKL